MVNVADKRADPFWQTGSPGFGVEITNACELEPTMRNMHGRSPLELHKRFEVERVEFLPGVYGIAVDLHAQRVGEVIDLFYRVPDFWVTVI